MGFDHIPIPSQLRRTLLATVLAAPAFGVEAPQEKKEGALPDVLIEAEHKRPVRRQKPPLDLSLKEDAPLESVLKTEEEAKTRLPMEIAQSTAYAPGVSDSGALLLPSSHWIVSTWDKEPVRVFYPMQELLKVFAPASKEDRSKSKWRLIVVDGAGKAFKGFEGPGLPPERLEFEGKGDNGDWVRPGQAYTGVLTFQDGAGRSHTAMGKPFAILGLGLLAPSGQPLLSLAARGLFQDKGMEAPKLSEHGRQLLLEAAGIVARRHPGLGLEVAARLSRGESAQVQAAADLCAGFLAKSLLRPAAAVAAKSYPATSDLEERVEILILNR